MPSQIVHCLLCDRRERTARSKFTTIMTVERQEKIYEEENQICNFQRTTLLVYPILLKVNEQNIRVCYSCHHGVNDHFDYDIWTAVREKMAKARAWFIKQHKD
ncbi:unnamed protein product [Rotaria magnacalcarata]